jgi:hypothetical protein
MRERVDDQVVRLFPLVARVRPLVVQAVLGAPAGLGRARIAAALASGGVGGERGGVAVVVRRLDQRRSGKARACFGVRAVACDLARGVLGGDDAEVGARRPGALEATEVADLGARAEGGRRVDPAQATRPGDGLCPRAVRPALADRAIERRAPLLEGLDRGRVVAEHGARGQIGRFDAGLPAAVALGLHGAGASEAKLAPSEEPRQAVGGTHRVPARGLAAAGKIAEALLVGVGTPTKVGSPAASGRAARRRGGRS